MANIWEKAISILEWNLNSGLSYFITTVSFFLILQEWVLTNTFKRNMVVKPQSTEWQWLPSWLPNRPKEWPNMDMVESLRNSRKNQNTILIVAVRHLLAVVVIQINHAYTYFNWKKVLIFMNKQKKNCLRFAVNKQTRYSWDPTTNSEVRREGEKYLKTAIVEECRSKQMPLWYT